MRRSSRAFSGRAAPPSYARSMTNCCATPVPQPNTAPSQYDRIAHLYDVDMARNMAFDDADFYTRVCAKVGGRVLEMGCGNGRILFALLRAGIDAVGIDGSANMLA